LLQYYNDFRSSIKFLGSQIHLQTAKPPTRTQLHHKLTPVSDEGFFPLKQFNLFHRTNEIFMFSIPLYTVYLYIVHTSIITPEFTCYSVHAFFIVTDKFVVFSLCSHNGKKKKRPNNSQYFLGVIFSCDVYATLHQWFVICLINSMTPLCNPFCCRVFP
jgi:hypothetical protein